jgi:hypothetical protein
MDQTKSIKNALISAMMQYRSQTGRDAGIILLGPEQFEQLCREAGMDEAMTKRYDLRVLSFAGAEVYEINHVQDMSVVMAGNVKVVPL